MMNGSSMTRLGLIRGLLTGLVLLTVAGSACRQTPNLLLFTSMNNTRAEKEAAASQWAEPMQVQGLPNMYKVSADLYRGAEPKPQGLPELQKLGVRTVIDLRESDSYGDRLTPLGITYERIPMSAFRVKDDDVVRFLQIAGNPGRAPVFVHCQRGADRTGLMSAIYRVAIQGWTKDEAIAEMTKGGFRFNRGFQNVVNYIRDVDINQLKQRAGLIPALTMNVN